MRKIPVLILVLAAAASCSRSGIVEMVTTTYDSPWQTVSPAVKGNGASSSIEIDLTKTGQTIEGFGSCFNELGWISLSALPEQDRTAIMEELFTPGAGLNLTLGRMPVGANDFSTDFYSYDETDGDFELEDFSIEHDRATLIPFIKAALSINPSIRVWASPWCPPSWMKTNGHYASKPSAINGMEPGQRIHEGEDGFIMKPGYLDTYARYFGRFIDAYRAEGIDIFMVMPQNEPNSDQGFPSCTWTAESLGAFIKTLGPQMSSRDVQIYLGTMERPDPDMWNIILHDPECMQYIKGMGFQWDGARALPALHAEYPQLPCAMTEQECGDGKNDWDGAVHSWNLMKHYISNGVSMYFYWNTSLQENGLSRWNWRQNSLITVDMEHGTYRYTPEFYILKHASHYVMKGAKYLATGGTNSDCLSFLNPDGSIVVIAGNGTDEETVTAVNVEGKCYNAPLAAHSLSTIIIR